MENDSNYKMHHIVKQREIETQEAIERYGVKSREQLKRNVETKIRTTMIGALAIIENKLGFLWGQGKPQDQLTEKELNMQQLKDELRTEILNNGNNQLRSALSEINQYDVSWNKYQYNINFKDGRNQS